MTQSEILNTMKLLDIKEMKSLMQLELYVAKNRTHSDNIWSEL